MAYHCKIPISKPLTLAIVFNHTNSSTDLKRNICVTEIKNFLPSLKDQSSKFLSVTDSPVNNIFRTNTAYQQLVETSPK